MEINVDLKDILEATTAQRNAAMDEIARQAAIIKALQRELEKKSDETSSSIATQLN